MRPATVKPSTRPPPELPAEAAGLLARCRFPPDEHLVCAVSGGPDSLALLILARATGRAGTAIPVDHGLRPGSADEAEVVATAARRLGAAFESCGVLVEKGPNLEARARAARYAALPPAVLTGHTADDQAETVLINLLRGSGLDGLAGMRPVGEHAPGQVPGQVTAPRRPLLALRRHETRALCRSMGFDPVRDPSNDDERYLRNRVRHELVPLLAALSDRDPVPILCRQADLLADEGQLLDELASALDPTDAAALASAPAALARRAVRSWLRAGSEGHPPSAAEVDRVLAVARREAAACQVSRGRRVARTAGRLRLVST